MSRNRDRRRSVSVFPNSAWATVADVPTGAPVIDGGVLKQKLQCFVNNGIDFVNCGRPANIINALNARNYRVKTIVAPSSTTSFMGIVGLASVSSNPQLKLLFRPTAEPTDFTTEMGFAVSSISTFGNYSIGEWIDIEVRANGASGAFFKNGVQIATPPVGTGLNTVDPFLIGAGKTGGDYFFGNILKVIICEFDGTPIDTFDFSDPTKFDGVTIISEQGTVGTVTDGTPTSALGYDLIPVSVLC